MRPAAVVMTLLLVVFFAWFFRKLTPSFHTENPRFEDVFPERQRARANEVRDYQSETPVPPTVVGLDTETEGFMMNPAVSSIGGDVYVVSTGGASIGTLIHQSRTGEILQAYRERGYGPGELAATFQISAFEDEVYVSERSRPMIHIFDRALHYRRALHVKNPGMIVFTDEQWLGEWHYGRNSIQDEGGHMLGILDPKSGAVLRRLVPFREKMFAVALSGGATRFREKIYAVSVNTFCLDIIDTKTWITRRIDLLDGIRILKPVPWETWAKKNKRNTNVQAIEAWLSTFARPLAIDVIGEKVVILFARGKAFFYDVFTSEGKLVSRNHPISSMVPFPKLHHGVVEGILTDQEDHQFYAYVDLNQVVRHGMAASVGK